jgi:chitosanase
MHFSAAEAKPSPTTVSKIVKKKSSKPAPKKVVKTVPKRKPTTTLAKKPDANDTQPASFWLSPTSRRRADQLISVFENSTTEIQYAYVENLDDGRGLTLGRAGFTTATCDALTVIEHYGSAGVSFAQFVPELNRLCDEHSDETSSLPEGEFSARWKQAAGDPAFREAQDQTVDELYYNPAMKAADKLGLETVVSRAELYDAAIQHGFGKDRDGLPALINRTNELIDQTNAAVMLDGRVQRGSEKLWLLAFLDVRQQDLLTPFNTATADGWSESTDRVECIRAQVLIKNVSLNGPMVCNVYGTEFTIK